MTQPWYSWSKETLQLHNDNFKRYKQQVGGYACLSDKISIEEFASIYNLGQERKHGTGRLHPFTEIDPNHLPWGIANMANYTDSGPSRPGLVRLRCVKQPAQPIPTPGRSHKERPSTVNATMVQADKYGLSNLVRAFEFPKQFMPELDAQTDDAEFEYDAESTGVLIQIRQKLIEVGAKGGANSWMILALADFMGYRRACLTRDIDTKATINDFAFIFKMGDHDRISPSGTSSRALLSFHLKGPEHGVM